MRRKEEADNYYSWEEIEKRILARMKRGSRPPLSLLERIKQSAQTLGAPKPPGLPKV